MKVSAAAVAFLATLPATPTLAQQCIAGGFFLEFDGACTHDSILEAYADQVFNAVGATDPSACTSSPEADLLAKVQLAGLTSIEDLCNTVYDTQEKVPFADAANRGTDLQFEQMFFNGRTDWQEEVETIYETEDKTATSILKEDAEAVRTFFEGIAQGRRVEWPGTLTNFQSSVTDTHGLETCTTNAAMCCWPKDRQANDHNGNCAKPYDENCVDKDPADNTNLCYVDLERGNASTGFDSTDVFVYPGDGNTGEGDIHCHGLAWSNDVNDHTARYKANNLFFVSMYDHMYQRGYVKNIPGAPMCGCVEQMPTVSRSDCTQVDLTETIEISFNANTNTFKSKLASVHVDFNACRGINNRNNDLWAYMARLYYQGDLTPAQFGEAGRIITNNGCEEATRFELNQRSLTPGYDHDIATYTNVAGRESMYLHEPYPNRAFTKSMTVGEDPASADPTKNHYGIIYRACQSCVNSHMKIFYRRRTPVPDGFNLGHNILHQRNNGNGQNVWDVDFSLHSTYEDALNDENAWLCPNNSFNYGATFYGECSPNGSRVRNQFSRFNVGSDRNDVAFFTNKPEDEGLQVVESPTTGPIKGRDWANGITLEDTDGTIYMGGSGRDIWWYHDDFNYHSEAVQGDHQVIVHVGSMSAIEPQSWSKTGIHFRTSLDTDSANYGLYLTGTEGVCVQGRMNKGNHAFHDSCVNPGATEAWLKVEKRMDTYYSFVGSQEGDNSPITWTLVNSKEIPGIGDSYYVGLAVSSARWWPMEVIFTGYERDEYNFPSAAPTSSSMPTIYVPSVDIGNVISAGSATQASDGSWVVKGAGWDIWGSNDSFHYVKFERSGNMEAELLVDSFDYINQWQKGGIMFRETLDTNSAHYSLFMSGSNGIANQFRTCTDCSSSNNHNSGLKTKPVWLKVTKVGSEFSTFYRYEDATEWTALWATTIDFADLYYVGIAVTSHDPNRLAELHAREFNLIETPASRNLRKG